MCQAVDHGMTCAEIAYETVLRACGFGSLAIFCVMIGLSFEPRAAFQAGGFLTLLMTVILILKAYEARTKDHRRTEMWLYLPEERRPPKASAQWAIFDGHARDLFPVRPLDGDHFHRDVGHSVVFFPHRALTRLPNEARRSEIGFAPESTDASFVF